jgi:hypothetical protein
MSLCPRCHERIPLALLFFSRRQLVCPICDAVLIKQPWGIQKSILMMTLLGGPLLVLCYWAVAMEASFAGYVVLAAGLFTALHIAAFFIDLEEVRSDTDNRDREYSDTTNR